MMARALWTASLLLAGLVGCNKQPAIAEQPVATNGISEQGVTWLTLAAPDTGTVLHYPPTWKLLDEGFGVHAASIPNDGANCAVLVGEAPIQVDDDLPLEWLNDELPTDHFTQVIERWSPTVSGRPARALLADYDQERPEGVVHTRMIQVQAPRRGRLYQLTCTSHRSTFESRRAVFDEILARWQVPNDV